MADWAIGDIQGCYKELKKLCKKIRFKPGQDRLWLVGDLVNRGPQSLETLQFLADFGDSVQIVLGNHDLHLLAVRAGATSLRSGDTLAETLDSPDADPLLDWLQSKPLVKAHEDGRHVMLHAGIVPQWSLNDALAHSDELQRVLKDKKSNQYFQGMYGNTPKQWNNKLKGIERWRFITNALTRLRYCGEDGQLEMKHKGPPILASTETIKPWYDWRPKDDSHCILTGHWSALGLRQTDNHISLDTGCVWGGQLTAYCLQDKRFVQVASKQPKASFM